MCLSGCGSCCCGQSENHFRDSLGGGEGSWVWFPVQVDFLECREEVAGSLGGFCSRWCKREHVECDSLKDWKSNIFKIIDRRISFCSRDTNMLPRKPKISYRYLKSGIEEFRGRCVLVPAGGAANNVVVVWRLRCIGALGRELGGAGACERTSEEGKSVIDNHIFHSATRFAVSVNEDQERLPTIYWLPGLHKRPCGARFIANSSSCTATE